MVLRPQTKKIIPLVRKLIS